MKNVIFFIIGGRMTRVLSSYKSTQPQPVFNFEAKICEVQELKIGVRIGPKYP